MDLGGASNWCALATLLDHSTVGHHLTIMVNHFSSKPIHNDFDRWLDPIQSGSILNQLCSPDFGNGV